MTKEELQSMMSELNGEIDAETNARSTPKEKQLSAVARKLLLLERDLSLPGSGSSDAQRQQRILDILADENF